MVCSIRDFLSIFGHFADTILANILSAVGDQTPGGPAEDTCRFEFLQDDPVILHVNFQLIPLRDIQRAAQLNGQNNSAELIYFSNNASGLHSGLFLLRLL